MGLINAVPSSDDIGEPGDNLTDSDFVLTILGTTKATPVVRP
jgi:hypothetical protein